MVHMLVQGSEADYSECTRGTNNIFAVRIGLVMTLCLTDWSFDLATRLHAVITMSLHP